MWIVVLLNNIDFSFVSFWENKKKYFYKNKFFKLFIVCVKLYLYLNQIYLFYNVKVKEICFKVFFCIVFGGLCFNINNDN